MVVRGVAVDVSPSKNQPKPEPKMTFLEPIPVPKAASSSKSAPSVVTRKRGDSFVDEDEKIHIKLPSSVAGSEKSGSGHWTLSRRKLEMARALPGSSNLFSNGSAATNGAVTARMDLSASACFGGDMKPLMSRHTFAPGVMSKAKQKQAFEGVSQEERLKITRTLSDPHINPALVVAEVDAKSLNDWIAMGSDGVSDKLSNSSLLVKARKKSMAANSWNAARALIYEMSEELKKAFPKIDNYAEALARRDRKVQAGFEEAKDNPLFHLEYAASQGNRARVKTMKIEAANDLLRSADSAPQVSLAMSNEGLNLKDAAAAASGKNLIVRKDCILEYDAKQLQYTFKYATCDRMIGSLVERFMELEGTGSLSVSRKERKANKGKSSELYASARHFCVGSLKLWSVTEILDSMRRLRDQMLAHANKMAGTGWAAGSDINGLEQLVRIWIQTCFPRCVSDSESLQSFTALVRDLPGKEELEAEMVQLAQANSIMNKRGLVQKKMSKKKTLPRFIAKPVPSDFLQLDLLAVPAADLALELTRVSLDLMRELPLDKLVHSSLKIDAEVAKKAQTIYDLPPLLVLRKRTERLSHWTASVVVAEKLLRRRVELYSKMVAVAAKLVDMRNLHDAVAMVSALHNPAVSRLRRTIQGAGDTVSSALTRLTNLIRPPYQNLRKMCVEAGEKDAAFLPPLEVLLQDISKLDEIEKNFSKHPESDLMLGNIWKMNLLGSWVTKFRDAFMDKSYDFESQSVDQRAVVISSFVKVLPDVFDDDTLWAMSKKLETNAEGP